MVRKIYTKYLGGGYLITNMRRCPRGYERIHGAEAKKVLKRRPWGGPRGARKRFIACREK